MLNWDSIVSVAEVLAAFAALADIGAALRYFVGSISGDRGILHLRSDRSPWLIGK